MSDKNVLQLEVITTVQSENIISPSSLSLFMVMDRTIISEYIFHSLNNTEFPDEKFARSDANHDDKLTFNEFLHTELAYEHVKRDEFKMLDLNNDGFISIGEYQQNLDDEKERSIERRAQYFGKIYEDFDEDFDMKMSEQEVRRMLAQRFLLKPRNNFARIFNSFDANKNGGLEIEEYLKFDEQLPFEEMDPIDEEMKNESTVALKREKEKLPLVKRQKDNKKP
ncbi:unnamed protein product [Anisakis simplex]|uniref:EF hand family protein n=1 Tax=Anisakis simplex TaxID=6269 RepID=A0A0M3JU66_ANISI|nr:unnamed protein product [Anisakis simplex]